MKYSAICFARFIQRDNRFVAQCQLEDTKEKVIVHVKNTGRGAEVLIPNALVVLHYCPSSTRKTSYDLVAVKKGLRWFNIDSQAPNQLVAEELSQEKIQLEGLKGKVISFKREVTFQQSRFDFYFETNQGEKGFIEVKGMTLENNQIGAFPDAPTLRGLKHVKELVMAQEQGYHCFVLFIAQFENIQQATIHRQMQPELYEAIDQAIQTGVMVLTYACSVTENEILIDKKISFDLETPFINPIIDRKEEKT